MNYTRVQLICAIMKKADHNSDMSIINYKAGYKRKDVYHYSMIRKERAKRQEDLAMSIYTGSPISQKVISHYLGKGAKIV